jgi:hypothetical protein
LTDVTTTQAVCRCVLSCCNQQPLDSNVNHIPLITTFRLPLLAFFMFDMGWQMENLSSFHSSHNLSFYESLKELWKAPTCFVMCVCCLSICPHKTGWLPPDIFSFLLKYASKIQLWSNLDKNIRHSTWRLKLIFWEYLTVSSYNNDSTLQSHSLISHVKCQTSLQMLHYSLISWQLFLLLLLLLLLVFLIYFSTWLNHLVLSCPTSLFLLKWNSSAILSTLVLALLFHIL